MKIKKIVIVPDLGPASWVQLADGRVIVAAAAVPPPEKKKGD